MQNVILIVHLLLALALIGVVLLQRSEGGGLGMGSGGGGGAMSARSAGTALGKLTWGLAAAFIATSLTLTIFAAQNSATGSVLDRLGVPGAATEDDGTGVPALDTDGLLPPPSGDSGSGDGPLIPQAE